MDKQLQLLAILWAISGVSAFGFFISRIFLIEHLYINPVLFDTLAIIGTISIVALIAILYTKDEQFAGPLKTAFRPWFRISLSVLFLGVLFKIQHWTGASILLSAALISLAVLSLVFGIKRSMFTWKRAKAIKP